MAAPAIVRVYPANSDLGIPTGATFAIYFDRGIDLNSVKNSIVVFAAENDTTSGPDQAVWLDQKGDQKYFLSSPGFNGYVPLKFELVYWDTTDLINQAEIISPSTITSEADELAANYGTKVKITIDPKFSSTWAPDTLYTLYINGDVDNTNTGVASRTTFDIASGVGNTGAGALANVYGTYSGLSNDVVNFEITKAGNIGTAEYKWWYTSAGALSAVTKRVTNRRYRTLDNGLQIRWSGSNFALGDIFSFNTETISRMATSTFVTFTTNDGTYTTAPDSPSTPATCSPPSTVLPGSVSSLAIESMLPENASYNIDITNRIITIVFSEDVDASTITDNSVTLWKYPVEGYYGSTFKPIELSKSLSVSGATLTIRF